MPWPRFVRIVQDIRTNGHRLQGLQLYGEPLLAERYPDAVRYLADVGVRVRNAFYSNALLLTPEMTDRLLDSGFLAVHAKCPKVWLGIDSMQADIYPRLRVGGDLDTVVANVRYFIDRTKAHLPGLAVQRMLTRLNPDEPMGPFRQFGVPVATRKVGRQSDKSRDLLVRPFDLDRRGECTQLAGTIFIGQDGRAVGCCLDGDLEQAFGNIDDSTIAELASCPARMRQQAELEGQDYSGLPVCDRCMGMESVGL